MKKKKEVEVVKELSLTEQYVEKLISAIVGIDIIEKEMREFSDKLSYVDKCKTTIDHYIENENIPYAGSRDILQEQKRILNLRRSIKQVYEIMKTYETHKNKLLSGGNREFLIAEIKRKLKELLSSQYKYEEDYYTKEQLDEISKKKKVVTNE